MKNKILEITNLSHKYTQNWAIHDINLVIDGKGVVGLLGSNGAGKSTTMNIVCGVLHQTQGEVKLNGINMRSNPKEAKRHLGFLPQKAPLYRDLSVDEYLYYCAVLRGIAKGDIPQAMKMAKEKCGLSDKGSRLLKHLSGGYQQRVGIAQAIIHQPLFVVLDEPTNGLDPNQILEVRRLVRDIAEERAVLISTHILSEVQAICDRIEMIDNGQLVFSGSLEEFKHYSAPSTLIAVMGNAPNDNILTQISGLCRIERLTKKRLRLHFNGQPDNVICQVVQNSVRNNWQLSEVYLEKESLDTIFAKLSGKEV